MTKINIITPPDKIYTDCFNILLINPSENIQSEMQNEVLSKFNFDCNLYFYDKKNYNINDFDWLMDIFHFCDIVVIDLDNASTHIKDIASYMIGKPKTYWLTNAENTVYNRISSNRIYNLSFLSNIGGLSEEE